MLGIYNCTPDTKHVCRIYNIAAVTNCATCNVISHVRYVLYFTSTFSEMCMCVLVLQDMIDKLTEIGRIYTMEINVEKKVIRI
jgi:hypothetical protein